MRRAPMRRDAAPQVMMELPTIRRLTFAPLPYDTHPIDTYDGPQGWGPFYGPWTPWDFRDPADGIALYYGQGESNDPGFAPPYDVLTLFGDNSLDYVNNTAYGYEMQNADAERAYTSTAANALVPRGPSMVDRLRSLLSPPDSSGGE